MSLLQYCTVLYCLILIRYELSLRMVKAGVPCRSYAATLQKLADLGDVVIQNNFCITISPKFVSFFLVYCIAVAQHLPGTCYASVWGTG
jgi:hypothetical protein